MSMSSGPTESRRIIRIGGPNAPKMISVPLSTTATFNILIGGGPERTNAAGIGTGTAIRTGPHGSEMAPRGILKSQHGSQPQNGLIYGGGSGASIITSHSTGTMASGNIVPQSVAMVASKNFDGSHMGSQTTMADVHLAHDPSEYKVSVTNAALVASGNSHYGSSLGVQTDGTGNLADRRSNTSTQVQESELGTLRKHNGLSSASIGGTSDLGVGAGFLASGANGNDGIYGGSRRNSGLDGKDGIYSGSKHNSDLDGKEGIYSGSTKDGGSGADSIYSANSAAKRLSSAADQVSVDTAAKLRSAPKRNSSMDGISAGGSRGGGSSDAGGKNADGEDIYSDSAAEANAFRFIGWDVDQDEDEDLPCQRVLVMKEVDMVLMFTARCTTEAVGNDPRLLNLMVDIADSCVKRLRLLTKDITSQNIAADNMDTLPLSDGRQTKEHLEELSQQVNETVALTDVAFRMQPPDGVYLGTFVQGTVVAKRNYAIGKVGVVAVLTKKSKFATVEAFSEQLCEHIASTRPANLGTVRGANTKNMSKSAMVKLQAAQRDQLLLQNFIFDPTIVVAEAARRSFVKIDGFLLFK